MKEKKGLSAVITILLLIVVVFIAVGIMWAFISNVITGGLDGLSVAGLFADLKIKSFVDNGDNLDVQVSAGSFDGELIGLRFVMYDGVQSETYDVKDIDLKNHETKTFKNIPFDSLVKEISVAPITESDSGKEIVGEEMGKLKVQTKEIVENSGATAWFKFDGDAYDEIRGIDARFNEGVPCNVEGKYRQACDFDGANFIETDTLRSVYFDADQGTMMAWINPHYDDAVGSQADDLDKIVSENDDRIGISIGNPSSLGKGIWVYGFDGQERKVNVEVSLNEWIHVGWVYGGGNIFAYKDGDFIMSESSGNIVVDSDILFGKNYDGLIDEIILFNRTLSHEEILAFSRLDLK